MALYTSHILSFSVTLHLGESYFLSIVLETVPECILIFPQRRINNVYDGGKLDLVSLIKLWNLSLRLYLEKLNEGIFSSLIYLMSLQIPVF